jgi:hypothetical protein
MTFDEDFVSAQIPRRHFLKAASASGPALLLCNDMAIANPSTPNGFPLDSPSQNLLVGYVTREKVDLGPDKLHEILSAPDSLSRAAKSLPCGITKPMHWSR